MYRIHIIKTLKSISDQWSSISHDIILISLDIFDHWEVGATMMVVHTLQLVHIGLMSGAGLVSHVLEATGVCVTLR